MSAEDVLLLTAEDVRKLLTMDECIAAVERAFRLYGEGKACPPAVLSMHAPNGTFHVKSGMLSLSRPYFAAKVNGNFPDNRTRFGLPTIQGMIVLCDAERGIPLAVMDSREITSLRTGAATAVAARYLARPDSHIATICGCGEQGRVQLKMLARVSRLQAVFAHDLDQGRAAAFAEELSEDLGISVTRTADLSSAVRQSDICVTCTTSRRPLLNANDVLPGAFIAAVGADNPEKQELHPDLMAKSKVVADTLDQCAAMGDLHHALEAGAVSRAEIFAELGEVVAGKKPGRESDAEIIVFDSTGMALQDVAAAAVVYENFTRAGGHSAIRALGEVAS
ncbi:MAG TPA: ornithine cyclodeaminase family protein [Terriglobales bacterium]|jgi:alanine dehydrogenase|nr:ornithine cyclodeaminase family protein [Terriglobales bacterium]